MKFFCNLSGRWLAIGVSAVIIESTLAALAADNVQNTARVTRVRGPARISTDRLNWQALKSGDFVPVTSLVQTAVKSDLEINLDGRGPGLAPASDKPNVVTLQSESVLNFNKMTGDSLELELLNGQIEGHFRKPPLGTRYEIIFPKGAVGIRGADFQFSNSGWVRVDSGSLVISMTIADGSLITKEVTTGQQFDPVTGSVTMAAPNQKPPPQTKVAPENPAPQPPAAPDIPQRDLPKRKF